MVRHYVISDARSVHTAFFDVRLWHGSAQPKVANHDLAIMVNEDVSWLDIAMDDVAAVQELHRAQGVVHYNFYMSLLKTTLSACLDQVFKVVV